MAQDLLFDEYIELVEGVHYYQKSFDNRYYFDSILNNTTWREESITYPQAGKVLIPRLLAWYGEGSYTYSGIKNEPVSFPENRPISNLKNEVEIKLGLTFNSCLLNYYRDGKDSIGWHSDDEKDLIESSPIVSVSLGCPRKFQLRSKKDSARIVSVDLGLGDLLVMNPGVQTNFEHRIPKEESKTGRINLTFRNVYVRQS